MKKAFIIFISGIFILGTFALIMAQSNGRRILPSPVKLVNSMQEKINDPLPPLKNPQIVVKKKERKLHIYDGDKLIRTYNIALGFAPEGDKEREGDGKTPEGEFYIFTKNPKSSFYLSLGISYPSIDDAKRGLEQKIITQKEHDQIVNAIKQKKMPPQYTALGGEIYIHAGGSATDWTLGCIALTREEIKEIFDAIPVGAKVTILP
jgi:murein L,D-transpeptidase YafK